MIKDYLQERKSWLALFLFLELFILFVAYLDPTIPFSSALYIVFLGPSSSLSSSSSAGKKRRRFINVCKSGNSVSILSLSCGRQVRSRESSSASSPAKRTNGNRNRRNTSPPWNKRKMNGCHGFMK
ncbi:hypothetical protein BJQ97_01261 [Geobacillus sp. TFV-3]|nr:hypothetical protein BJQ97_01261 [Geobacillus sp. TFV-3]